VFRNKATLSESIAVVALASLAVVLVEAWSMAWESLASIVVVAALKDMMRKQNRRELIIDWVP
jgi:hypothetical protein